MFVCVCVYKYSPNMSVFRQLRASVDQRLHYAVVSHHVRHLPAVAHRAEDLGFSFLRGFGGAVPGRPRHLGETGRVSGLLLTLLVFVL